MIAPATADDLDWGDALDWFESDSEVAAKRAVQTTLGALAPLRPSSPPPSEAPTNHEEKPMAKNCEKCGNPLRSDNTVGVCGDAAACRRRQSPSAPVPATKPVAPTKQRAPQPAPEPAQPGAAAQFGVALAKFAGSPLALPPVEELPMGYALAVHAYVSAAIEKVTTTK